MDEIISRVMKYDPCLSGRAFLRTVTSVDDALDRASSDHLEWLYCSIHGAESTAWDEFIALSRSAWRKFDEDTVLHRMERRAALARAVTSDEYTKAYMDYDAAVAPAHDARDKTLRAFLTKALKEWATHGIPSV